MPKSNTGGRCSATAFHKLQTYKCAGREGEGEGWRQPRGVMPQINRCIMQKLPGRQFGITTEECERGAKNQWVTQQFNPPHWWKRIVFSRVYLEQPVKQQGVFIMFQNHHNHAESGRKLHCRIDVLFLSLTKTWWEKLPGCLQPSLLKISKTISSSQMHRTDFLFY